MRIVTIGRNKKNGDRSYSHGIWQITGENQRFVMVYPIMDNFWGKSTRKRKHILFLDEHDFDDARPLLSEKDYQHCLCMALVE